MPRNMQTDSPNIIKNALFSSKLVDPEVELEPAIRGLLPLLPMP